MVKLRELLLYIFLIGTYFLSGQTIQSIIQKNPSNPNYFINADGKAVLLTGSHTWANFQEFGLVEQPKFDWKGYLDMLSDNGHNFIRLWVWEQSKNICWTNDQVFIDPMPYHRTSKGTALDGKDKFDLSKFNQNYFDRLRKRVIEAGDRGIYVSVMLFQGWSMNLMKLDGGDPYDGHPYNGANNINGIHFSNTFNDSDTEPTLHSLLIPEILKLQEAYVEKVIETVNDLDNVLYEVINEGGSIDWQNHMVSFIKNKESKLDKQHVVGITQRYIPYLMNRELDKSNADWISYTDEPEGRNFPKTTPLADYSMDPPENTSGKVSILDTDHIWGLGGNYLWVWKAFCRGHNPIFMDPWQPLAGRLLSDNLFSAKVSGGISKNSRDYPDWGLIRSNMGYIRNLSAKVNLSKMKPAGHLSSTKYCLANPGEEYIVFIPTGQRITLDLTEIKQNFEVVWILPLLGKWIRGTEKIQGGKYTAITPPFSGASVLWLKSIQDQR